MRGPWKGRGGGSPLNPRRVASAGGGGGVLQQWLPASASVIRSTISNQNPDAQYLKKGVFIAHFAPTGYIHAAPGAVGVAFWDSSTAVCLASVPLRAGGACVFPIA